MVRMNPLNDADGETNAADRASEESKTASAGSFKRTRSSLDYKGDPSSDTIIPKEIQSKLFEAGATTGGGRSKDQADSDKYNPFAGMTSEEVLRHLYENPELAKSLGIDPAAAGAAAGITKKTYRTQLLQKQGFPFVQWAIVLLIGAFACYRAYKFAKPQPSTVKQKVKRKGGKQVSEKPRPKDDLVLSKVIAEIEGAGDDAKDATDKGQQKKSKKKQAKKVKAKPAQSTPKAKESSESDDSDAEPAAPAAAKPKKKKVKLVEEPVLIVPEDDSSDWHVVGTKAAPVAVPSTNGSASKPAAIEEATPLLNGSGKSDDSEPEKKKKKKPKKKKADTDNGKLSPAVADELAASTPSAGDGDGAVDDDEALALRLQAEENNFASQATEDDVWAEVATKKKKGKVAELS